MAETRIAKLIDDGDDQIVLLPVEFHLRSKEVRVTRTGNKILLTPLDDDQDSPD